MDQTYPPLTEPGTAPSASQVEVWLGPQAYPRWLEITQFIEFNYPGVFTPEWLYGGKKNGWCVRYKKGKSFCTLTPEKGRLAVMIVFGAEERARVDTIRPQLSERTGLQYDQAKTFHDGKWLFMTVEDDEVVKDVETLLKAKRKPKK